MSFFDSNGMRHLAGLVKADLGRKVDSDRLDTILLERSMAEHPVGTILFNTSGANPADYMGFGTWVAWGAGRVPVGVDSTDANFETAEKTGGASAVSLAHSHTVNSHAHTMGHTHTVAEHAHEMGHTHTVNSHAHTMGHTHTTGDCTLTVSQIPAHSHSVTRNFPYGQDWGGGSAWSAYSSYQHSPNNMSMVCGNTGGGQAHNHGRTGVSSAANTGSASPATGNSSITSTGKASPATGQPSSASTGNATPGTSSALGDVSNLQPYITCYMWKRTA